LYLGLKGTNFIFVQYALRKTDILKNAFGSEINYISNFEVFKSLLKQYAYDDLFIDSAAKDFGHATPFGNRVIAENVAQELLKLTELNE
tara:strand:- start:635 stop:901 length:267 start_codon:yes stop_codon:yes gene_type:complete